MYVGGHSHAVAFLAAITAGHGPERFSSAVECAAEFGAVFIPVPGDVMDSDGILLPRYGSDDATHGSAEYAARLWKEVAAAMKGKESDS